MLDGEKAEQHGVDKERANLVDDGNREEEQKEKNEVEETEEVLYRITDKQRLNLKLNDETIEAIKDVFRMLDKDGSGTLDSSELGNALTSMGVDCGEKEIDELMKQIDEDGNGTVDFFEFAQMVSSKMSEYDPEIELKEAFAVFDINGDGKISVDELRAVVESLGGSMTDEELENMLLEADDNNDGYLDYSEFVRIWMGKDASAAETKPDLDEPFLEVEKSEYVKNTQI